MGDSYYQSQLLTDVEPARRDGVLSMLSRIELEITTACNLRCYNCDRSSRQALSAEMMNVAQITRFVDESLALNWRWTKITLLGGEPTLHPNLFSIFAELSRYRTVFPDTRVQIISNGYGDKVSSVLEKIPAWAEIRNSAKDSPKQDSFDAYNIAPQDLPEFKDADYSQGCWIPFRCGMALTRYGFYPCGAGASIDRVFGWGLGIRTLHDVTPARLTAEFLKLCRYCGHFHGIKKSGEVMSPSWIEGYQNWHRKRPLMPLYGEE